MKKIVLCAFSVFLILSFVSCGSDPKNDDDTVDAPVVTQPVETFDNAAVLKTVESARQAALELGAEEKSADKLTDIDALYNAIKAKADGEDSISEEGKDIADRYLALAGYLSAKDAKEKIEGTDKIFIAQALYDDGCEALSELEELFESSEATGSQMLNKATNASTLLNSALATVYKKVAKDERDAAMAAKKNADSVKAGVSMKVKYNEAVTSFKAGDSAYSMQNPAKAYDNYKAAKEVFTALYEEVSAKREAALKAIEDAKKSVLEVENFAETADEQAPITEPVEGIEEEDAVLLEEETYADPAEAEADLPENPEDPIQDAVNEAIDEAVSGILDAGDAK